MGQDGAPSTRTEEQPRNDERRDDHGVHRIIVLLWHLDRGAAQRLEEVDTGLVGDPDRRREEPREGQ